MKIKIGTPVHQPFMSVFEQFDETLLHKLSPPFPLVKITTFGQEIGDEVSLILDFFIIRQKWISIITEKQILEEYAFFIDQGKVLPFFLNYWKHKHIVLKNGQNSKIIDEIEFRTASILTDYLFYPILYLQFFYRKSIYRKFFGENE